MVFSTTKELNSIQNVLSKYARLPFFDNAIPGAIMEAVLAYVRDAEVLNTYDFIDVVKPTSAIGWQVKSTKETTPVTWKRAKIPNSQNLIEKSRINEKGLQVLGNTIIKFCNDHAADSLNKYNIDKIGYSRLILHKNREISYFERELCSRMSPKVFIEEDFIWKWSSPKKTKRKEQLPALHGIHKDTKKKWWAWHGLGENQLHFSGEKYWWNAPDTKSKFVFQLPKAEDKISLEQFFELIDSLDASN